MSLRFVLLAMTVLLLGCSSTESISLTEWTFRTETSAPTPIVLPQHFDARLPNARSQYWLETTLRASQDGDLDLVVPYVAANTTLVVNGRDAPAVGEPELVLGYRRSTPQRFRIVRYPGENDLALSLRVEHTWTQSAWFDTVPKIVRAGAPDLQSRTIRFLDLDVASFAFAVLAQVALTYLFVFLIDRRRRTYFWFGVQGLAAAYYPFFVLGHSQLVSHFDVNLLTIFLSSASVAAVYFTHALFELPRPSRIWLALLAVSLGVALIGHDPFLAPRLAIASAFTITLTVLYQVWLCAKLFGKKPGAGLLLAGWLMLGATSWNDLLAWVGGGEHYVGARGACIGLATFSLFQTLLLSRSHVRSLADADALNVQLRRRVEALEESGHEISDLNDELRRQIGDRSRQLFAALALIGRKVEVQSALLPGSLVQDRYRIVREIGAGGMGTVYEVMKVGSDQRLALKVARSASGVELARLAREAQIASEISHPNVVQILDVDVATGGYLYLVLEYVDGAPLSSMREQGRDAAFTTSMVLQIARGLVALHDKGIIHRDLKPANVLVASAEDGSFTAKLADFGISRQLGDVTGEPAAPPPVVVVTESVTVPPGTPDEDGTRRLALTPPVVAAESSRTPLSSARLLSVSPLTETGAIAGTPMYMAPELADGPDALTPAVDIFSLGVIAFELLTGRKPFPRPPTELRLAGRSVPLAPLLRDERPDLGRALADLLSACLSLDPELRPTAAEIAVALEASS